MVPGTEDPGPGSEKSRPANGSSNILALFPAGGACACICADARAGVGACAGVGARAGAGAGAKRKVLFPALTFVLLFLFLIFEDLVSVLKQFIQTRKYVNGILFTSGSGVGGSSTGGIFIQTGSFYNTTNNVGITGSLVVSGSVSASAFNIVSTGTPQISSATNLNLTAGSAVIVTSSPFRLTSYSDAQTSSLTPQNGDMYYNTTTNKFMGYANSVWVALH